LARFHFLSFPLLMSLLFNFSRLLVAAKILGLRFVVGALADDSFGYHSAVIRLEIKEAIGR